MIKFGPDASVCVGGRVCSGRGWLSEPDFWQAPKRSATAVNGRKRRLRWITYSFAFPRGRNHADSLLLNPLVVSMVKSPGGPLRSTVPFFSADTAQRFQPGANTPTISQAAMNVPGLVGSPLLAGPRLKLRKRLSGDQST